MKRTGTILLLILITVPTVKAQSFKDRLIGMRKEYDTMRVLHLIMSVRVFENEQATKPFFQEVADIKKLGDNFRSKLGPTNMLMNSKYLIVTDMNSKEIVCSKRSSKDQEKFLKNPIVFNLDSILALYQTPKVWPMEGTLEHYSIEQTKNAIKRIDLFIDVNTNRLRKMEYRYTDNHYVIIEFTVFDTQPLFDENTFDEKYFVIADKGTLRASQAFRGYRVVMMEK